MLAACHQVMSWFDVADGHLRFRGKVTRDPIREWLATHDGGAAAEAAGRQIRFSLFGRVRRARRRISSGLWDAISASAVRDAVAAECDRYLATWTPLAYAPSLPRLSIAYRRLVVVPRVMIVWHNASRLTARIAESLHVDVPDSFRMFFSHWVLTRMDDAIRRAGPCPQRPVHAQESWACVALDHQMLWVDPSRSGPEWQGHVVLFEMPAPRLQRRDRRELETTIEQLTQSLHNLTRIQRDRTVRLALDQMATVRA